MSSEPSPSTSRGRGRPLGPPPPSPSCGRGRPKGGKNKTRHCSICNFSTNRAYNLYRHMGTHSRQEYIQKEDQQKELNNLLGALGETANQPNLSSSRFKFYQSSLQICEKLGFLGCSEIRKDDVISFIDEIINFISNSQHVSFENSAFACFPNNLYVDCIFKYPSYSLAQSEIHRFFEVSLYSRWFFIDDEKIILRSENLISNHIEIFYSKVVQPSTQSVSVPTNQCFTSRVCVV